MEGQEETAGRPPADQSLHRRAGGGDKEPLLEVQGLTVSYRTGEETRPALSGVDLTLHEGRCLGVVGLSGAGKTTLGLAVAGLIDEREARMSGTINFRGRDLRGLDETRLAQLRGSEIAMIFQDPMASLDPAITIVEQVAEAFRLAGRARKESRRLALEALADAGIPKELSSRDPYAHQLSGGECQRVMIAAALAGGPRLLVADEPTSSLDVVLQAQVVDLIRRKQRRSGLAVLFISHDLPLVASFADEIAVLLDGRVVEYGESRQVIEAPRHEFTAAMVSAALALAGGENAPS